MTGLGSIGMMVSGAGGVLIFQRFKAMSVRNVHATIFGFELVKRRVSLPLKTVPLFVWYRRDD